MPPRLLRQIAWGLVWRWSILLISLIAPAPPAAIAGIGLLLLVGLIASIWRRRGLPGSAWRLLLAVSIVNLGFWLGSPLLVPAITLALAVTVVDIWWSTGGADARTQFAVREEPGTAIVSYRPVDAVQPVDQARPRETAGGFRFLVAACAVLVVFTVAAFTMASGASAGFSTAIASIGKKFDQLTAGVPSATGAPAPRTAQPTPAPSDSVIALTPNGNDGQQPPESMPKIELPGLCVSLPDHRYEVRLPNGQVIVIATKHRDGCPDLSTILKALQDARGRSDQQP